jgi:hypothetical protein
MLSFKAIIPRTRLITSSSLRLSSSSFLNLRCNFSSSVAPSSFEEELLKIPVSYHAFDSKLDFEESERHIKDLHNGLRVIKTAAVRGIEFNQPHEGNYLTQPLLTHLHKKLGLLQGNWTANAIFLASKSIDLFSVGIHDEDSHSDEGLALYQKIQDIAEMIEYYPEKNLLALYGGYVTGTPFGLFLSSPVSLLSPLVPFIFSICLFLSLSLSPLSPLDSSLLSIP